MRMVRSIKDASFCPGKGRPAETSRARFSDFSAEGPLWNLSDGFKGLRIQMNLSLN